jgi:hypothetical protein
MRVLLSVAALAAGLWLLCLGYQRQQSLEGKAAQSLSRVGRSIDGGTHLTDAARYYIAGGILAAAGALGSGLIRR